ncbi:cysteine protease domain-containing protein [Colletotrichum sublineola]|uniref:Putative cysteine protease domain-containing protein n=1 Tax=Colletotrichum sublineola TaxID=1173701 RepID=A0A066WZ98_COLSU|nr:cysteine protease domain-containing protein [Colletotrichum sublineola]KDN62193.1 putative cysteine protease domain-containing protein [Colletotrichum sublineola]
MVGSKNFEQSPPLTASDSADHAKRSNTPALLVRRSSLMSKFPESGSSAYVLDWETNNCKQRLLNHADDLLREAVGRRRLTIVQGLPLDLVQVLRDSLGVSPGFLEAHAGRRRHRSSRQDDGSSFISFEYPELVKTARGNYGPESNYPGYKPSARQSDLVDVMDEAPFHMMTKDGQAVMFCRASLWMSSKADALFLDRPIWNDPSSQVKKARRPLSVTRSWQTKIDESQMDGTSVWNVLIAEGDELPGLEDSLLRTFRHSNVARQNLPDILHEAVYDKWQDFFEALPPCAQSGSLQDSSLYWQATGSLEQNLDSAYAQEPQPLAGDARQSEWRSLLERLQRRVAISQLGTSTVPQTPGWLRTQPTTAVLQTRDMNLPELGSRPIMDDGSGWSDGKEANQRALDRVTYLGGIILPFTVVSAILSMNEEYSPNAPHFWVFWVASIGAAILCLSIIYLDQLRCLEVYFEVAAADKVESILTSVKTHSGLGIPPISLAASGTRWPSRLTTEMIVDGPEPGMDNMEVMADSAVNPTMIVQQCTNGSKPKAWQKRQLGWGGAVKKVIGYYWWMGTEPVQLSPYGEIFRMKAV